MPRNAVPKNTKPKAAAPKAASLDAVFDDLLALLVPYTRQFSVAKGRVLVRGKRDYHLISTKEVTVDGRKRDEMWFASLIAQKGYIGFYFPPMNNSPSVKKVMAPELLRLLKGKSCFQVKELTPEVKAGIQDALKAGADCYKAKGWA
jgi:hypothetical protein